MQVAVEWEAITRACGTPVMVVVLATVVAMAATEVEHRATVVATITVVATRVATVRRTRTASSSTAEEVCAVVCRAIDDVALIFCWSVSIGGHVRPCCTALAVNCLRIHDICCIFIALLYRFCVNRLAEIRYSLYIVLHVCNDCCVT